MGLFDKIKSVAKTVTETATDKIASAQNAKNEAELAKYAKDEPVQNLPVIGTIRGFAGLENLTGAQLCLDGETDCVYIRIKAEKGPYKYSCIGTFPVDSFVELHYLESETRKMSSMTMFIDYFELIDANSTNIKFYLAINSFNAESDEVPQLNDFEVKTRMNLIYPFVHILADEETKAWVRGFCADNNLLPLIDDNGEVIAENMRKNADLVCNKE